MAIGEQGHEKLVEELISFFKFDRRLAETVRLAQTNTPVCKLNELLCISKLATSELSSLIDRLQIEIDRLQIEIDAL